MFGVCTCMWVCVEMFSGVYICVMVCICAMMFVSTSIEGQWIVSISKETEY